MSSSSARGRGAVAISPSADTTTPRDRSIVVRRVPLTVRDRAAVWALTSAGAAAGAWLSVPATGPSPSGATVPDALLTAALVGATCWAAATAPWWALTVSGGVVAASASDRVGLVLGLAAALVGGVIGARSLDRPARRAVAGAAVAVAALRLEVPGPFGTETMVAAVVFGVLIITGAGHRAGPVGRRTAIVAGITAAAALVMTGLVGLTALGSRSPLTDGNDLARQGLDALSTGDLEGAGAAFRSASTAFDRATDTLDQVWTRPAGLVPVVAQHRRAAVTLASGAATATERLATTLAVLDVDSVRIVDGRIDVEAVVELEPSLLDLQATVELLDEVIERADSPWLVDAVGRRLDDLAVDLEDRRQQGEVAIEAVRLAPALLGADRPMTYLVAFVTPAEVRGSLGFMGNYAELTIDQGRIELTAIGRHTDPAEGGRQMTGDPPTCWIESMDEFLSRYGRIGFANRAEGAASPQVWQIVTASPHFPSTAEVVAQLYPQSGGRPLDGVLALDPEVMAALIGFTGPIVMADLVADLVADLGEAGIDAVTELPEQIDVDNAVEFLLLDQYLLSEDDDPERIDALELMSLETVERLLAGALPGPTELGRVLGPLAADGHLAAWMVDPDAQALIADLGLDHALPSLDGGDGVAVALNNGSGNKIEVFLDVDARYHRRIDPTTGFLDGTLTVTFTNRAPSEGLPRYVIGNAVGRPLGWNRLMVALFAPFADTGSTIDGEPVDMNYDVEQGWSVMGRMIEIPAGASRTVEIGFSGTLERFGPEVEPVVMLPNLATRPSIEITTEWVVSP